MKRVASVALVAVAVLLHAGCGYALAGRGSFLPANIMTVGIPEFINSTPFFGIEQMLTEKIRSEFIGRGKYTILIDAAGADAVLTGQVTGVTVQPVGFTEQQLASRYLFAVTMRLSFTDAQTNEVLWSNDSMTFREEYELATRGTTALDGGSFLDQERSSFERISSDVARTVVTAILEAF